MVRVYATNPDNVAAGGGWQLLAPLSVGRNRLGGAAVGGKLYAMGEQRLYDEYHGNYDVVEEYDPATDAWTRMAPLPKAIGHTTPGVFAHAEMGGLFVLGGTPPPPPPHVGVVVSMSIALVAALVCTVMTSSTRMHIQRMVMRMSACTLFALYAQQCPY